MDELYDPGPSSVPKDLARPSRRYKRHVWLALLALLIFVALYLALTAWFVWSTYRLLTGAFGGGSNAVTGFLAAVPMLFLSIFMLKALFFSERRKHTRDSEVKRVQEPELFQFLYRIADEAGAPRPHRVFLSPHPDPDRSISWQWLPLRTNLSSCLLTIRVISMVSSE